MNKQATGDGTVGKALDVLDRVAAVGRPVRFSELLSDSVHPKATLYRLLQTLVSQGMLAYDEGQQTYSLGIRLVRLAHAAWRQSSIAPIARPFVRKLSEEVGETVHLAQLDGGQVLYVDKRNAINPIDMYSQAGKIGPGYCTGVGKALLAFLEPAELAEAIKKQSFYRYTPATLSSEADLRADLEEIRRQGVAFDRRSMNPALSASPRRCCRQRGVPSGRCPSQRQPHERVWKSFQRYSPSFENRFRNRCSR